MPPHSKIGNTGIIRYEIKKKNMYEMLIEIKDTKIKQRNKNYLCFKQSEPSIFNPFCV